MYEEFFKLTDKPFALNPDPHFYYGSKEHDRVLAYLRYGLNQAEGFIVVTGDVGAGKTTLIAALLEEINKYDDIIASQLVTTQLQPDDLLKMVSNAFGLPYAGMSKSELLTSIENFLRKQAKKKKRVLLIVDEAQNLESHSLEELRMLSNFHEKTKSLLQSFLLGQGEFRDLLRASNLEQFRQRIIASYHLGPMSKIESRCYIEHRLKIAGWRNDPLFLNDAYDDIYKHTHGIPRRINTLCDRIMLYAYTEELHEIPVDVVNSVVKELEEELHFTSNGEESGIRKGSVKAASAAVPASSRKLSGDDAARIDLLENRVSELEAILFKGKSFLDSLMSYSKK